MIDDDTPVDESAIAFTSLIGDKSKIYLILMLSFDIVANSRLYRSYTHIHFTDIYGATPIPSTLYNINQMYIDTSDINYSKTLVSPHNKRIAVYGKSFMSKPGILEFTQTGYPGYIGYDGASGQGMPNIFGIYPVMLKDGVEVGKLNPRDLTKYLDGSPADIYSGAEGDVMMAYPYTPWQYKGTHSGNYYQVYVKDNAHFYTKADGSYSLSNPAYSHVRGTRKCGTLYLGVYLASEVDGKMRSLSGKSPVVNKSMNQFRALARQNGEYYDLMGFYQATFIKLLAMTASINTFNSQSNAVGICTGATTLSNTGGSETYGVDSIAGSPTDTSKHVKVIGLEDFYGNGLQLIDGIKLGSDENVSLLTNLTNEFEDSKITSWAGSFKLALTDKTKGNGFLSHIMDGSERFLFIPDANSGLVQRGTSTTGYCDYVAFMPDDVNVEDHYITIGGNETEGQPGIFSMRANFGVSSPGNSITTTRLMYLKPDEEA